MVLIQRVWAGALGEKSQEVTPAAATTVYIMYGKLAQTIPPAKGGGRKI